MPTLKPLGRKEPTDFEHVDKYPLKAIPRAEIPYQVPVVIGVNWYRKFFTPELLEGRWWIGRGTNWGPNDGGHAFCLKPGQRPDPDSWWDFYDQVNDGACVGFASSRMMSLLNRSRYDARWLWDRAKSVDEWQETNPGDNEGTSVRAAMDILRDRGHVPWKSTYASYDWQERESEIPVANHGIMANRWATTVDEIAAILDSPITDSLQAVPFLNSWGRWYPHVCWLPYEALQRLLDENGEATLIVDR